MRVLLNMFAEPRIVTDPSICFFYHVMDIPGYERQDAQWDLRGKFSEYIGHVDVSGKRVLDVGCASGFLSFSAEAAGASEVVSFDMDGAHRQHLLPFHTKPYFSDHQAWLKTQDAYIDKWKNAYWLAHRCLHSKAKVFYGDVYALPEALGPFDVVIVGAVLEHLSDPIRAMASIAKLARHTIVISTELLETEEPIAEFRGRIDRPDIDYMFWAYSIGVYRHVLAMLGFTIVRTVTGNFRSEFLKGEFPRTAIVAERSPAPRN